MTYQSDDGRGPKYNSVALFVDGAAQGINMWRTIPNKDDWENGVEFKALVGGLAEGTHEYHFSCAVGTSQHNVRYPESGESSGPTVGEGVGLQVTITPHASYEVGDWAECDIEVRDENGDLTDPDEWEFWRTDNLQILYAEDTAVSPPYGHTETGTYFLKDYNSPLTAGYHRYKMVVWKSGYPRVDKFLELPVAVTPDVPVRIPDINVSPTHFKPSSGDVSVFYDLSADAYVRVDVYDASENLVKTIAGPNAFRAAGSHSETWSGSDAGGSPVGVGQYRVEVWARADVSAYGNGVLYDGHQSAVDGSADNLTNKPSDILYDRVKDQVILTEDFLNDTGSQTQRFTVDGTFVANFPSVSGMYAKNAVAEDTDGNYYVQDIEGSVFMFNSSFASQGSILNVHTSAEHAALATLGSTYLYAADNNWGQIVRKDLQGGDTTSVPYPHNSWQADGIAVDENEKVWVAYSAPNNVIYKYDLNLTYLNVSFPFGLSTAGADLCVKHGNLLYLLLYSGTLRVYDIKNEVWIPDITMNNTRPSAIDAAESGYTFVNCDDGGYNAIRFRDRISADSNFVLVEAVAVVPDAEITSPTDGQTVGLDTLASVTIRGAARAAAGTTFDRYMLDVGQGASPTEWGLIIERDAEVDNGVIGEWSLNGVWDGDYTIRLRVLDTQGVVGEDRVTVDVQAPNQPAETYAIADALSGDSITVHLSARDDTTPDEDVQYSWQLNYGSWSAYTTDTAIALVGIGRGQNTFRAMAKDAEGLIDQTAATLTIHGTVDHAPNTPVNIHPFGGQPDAPLTPTLIGSVFRDVDPASTFSKAQFQIRADDGDYGSAVFAPEIEPGANHVNVPPSSLQNNQSYWFRCRYQDDSGQWSAWSAETSFSTAQLHIAWLLPSAITYGTALSSSQLNATADVPGIFAYTPAAGTVLLAGNGQELSVIFTPTDTNNYTPATAVVSLDVLRAPLSITANDRSKTYGEEVVFAGNEFTADGLVNGETVTGVTLTSAGAEATASVTDSPYDIIASGATGTGLANYEISYQAGTLVIVPALPQITWAAPSAITYGTALSSSQLNATADVPGTFAYTPPAGTVLLAGNGQELSVTFTPADTVNYTPATAVVSLDVLTAPLSITANDRSKTYGAEVVFAGTGFTVNGLVNGDTVTGLTLTSAGAGATATVDGSPYDITASDATGTGLANYDISYQAGTLVIAPALPQITWAAPSAITYGTGLSGNQLNATADVPGTFAYTPPAGTVLSAGNGQELSVTFTPADTVNYTPVTAVVSLDVLEAPPSISAQNRSNGLEIMVAGTPRVPYRIETSRNLESWLALGIVTADTAGVGTIVDADILAGRYRFYRARVSSDGVQVNFAEGVGSFYVVSSDPAPPGPWVYEADQGKWLGQHGNDDCGEPNYSLLNSPAYVVAATGEVVVSFAHRYSFEGDLWDGGQLRMSVDGGEYETVPPEAFTAHGYTEGYLTGEHILKGQRGFNGESTGYQDGTMITSVATLGTFDEGTIISLQFACGWDNCVTGTVPNWVLGSVVSEQLVFGNAAQGLPLPR